MSKSRDLGEFPAVALDIDASGNLDVTGTVTADGLVISGAGFIAPSISGDSTSETQLRFNTNTASRISNQANTALIFDTNAVERLRIDNAGNVGIGTSSPSATLELNSASQNAAKLRIGRSTAHDNYLQLDTAGGESQLTAIGASSVYGSMIFSRNNGATTSESMRIDSTGNVGIGESSPNAALQVAKGLATAGGPAAGAGTGSACFGNDTSGNAYGLVVGADGYGAGYISAQRTDGTAQTYPLFLQPNGGNVGIGTISPATNLEVSSETGAVLRLTSSELSAVANQQIGKIEFYTGDLDSPRVGAYIQSTSQETYGRTSDLRFGVSSSINAAATEAMRIDSAGNLTVPAMYNNTSGGAANLGVAPSGEIYRSTSSLKYKRDVENAVHGLAEVLSLRPVTYKGKSERDGENIFGGLIAEEVHAAGLTEFVEYAEDGSPDALAYGNMVSICIKAIQEQQTLIEVLTARITSLEANTI